MSCSRRSNSCLWIFFTPLFLIHSKPAWSPAIPCILGVPLSNLSGKNSGWISASLKLPVPPKTSGSILSIAKLSATISAPTPIGDNKPLCALRARKSTWLITSFISTQPTLCAPSSKNATLCAFASVLKYSSGIIAPLTLLICAQAKSFAPFNIDSALFKSTACIELHGISRTSKFKRSFSALRGRLIALCSICVTTTMSLSFKKPCKRVLIAIVALRVKRMRLQSFKPMRLARALRVW